MKIKEQEPLTLLKLREKAGLTQRRLAEALDVTNNTISAWETGRHEPRLTISQMKLLMDTLNCSFEDLLRATQEQAQET